MLKWVGIAYLKNILIKINFSKHIKHLQTCVEMAKILYIHKHHSIIIQKLHNGEHNEWAKTNI